MGYFYQRGEEARPIFTLDLHCLIGFRAIEDGQDGSESAPLKPVLRKG